MTSRARFAPAGPLRGTLRPPPDKSISHRAALLAAIAGGEGRIEGYLDAADGRSTLAAVRALGAEVTESGPSAAPGGIDLRVRGIGLRGPGERWPGAGARAGAVPIDVGNAGTLLRILPGWLAGQERGAWTLEGDASIRRRPVDRVAEPLRRMGAVVETRVGGLPPLHVEGSELRGIDYELPVASAQVKSCLLLAGLLASGETTIGEPRRSRDHTERLLAAAGARIEAGEPWTATGEPRGPAPEEPRGSASAAGSAARRVRIHPAERLEPRSVAVPADFSSAAFHVVAALLVPGSEVRLEGVGLNPTRTGLLTILERMGARLEVEPDELGATDDEPRGSILARHSALHGTEVGPATVPLAIDELPLVGLLGCFAEGETVVGGAEELRHKESDRIAALVDGLAALGAEVEARPDGFAVSGPGGLRGGTLDARGDHRLAMLGAVAGLASRDGVEVLGADAAAISYPGFERDLRALVD